MVRREAGTTASIVKPAVAIGLAETAAAIGRCHAVMTELRPHHGARAKFIRQVQKQQAEGFRLAFLEAEGKIRAVAGYRILELLFSGRTLYVDDLVTREADRSLGFGGQLFDWLVAEARRAKCAAFSLDSGVHRFEAHRFYLRKRMKIAAHHFTLDLSEK
jgi:GNAT superfamily N-acetyltransferase